MLLLKGPEQNQKPSRKGCSDLQEQHADTLIITKQKSEQFAPKQLLPNESRCLGGTVSGLLSLPSALIHQMRGIKSDQ